ncbi:MAG TPA: hypothetical protein VKV38_15270 [Trebonia sp.]|jgi:hypothetical protein|nr:hypothetical protein [Trebonia sp.]
MARLAGEPGFAGPNFGKLAGLPARASPAADRAAVKAAVMTAQDAKAGGCAHTQGAAVTWTTPAGLTYHKEPRCYPV